MESPTDATSRVTIRVPESLLEEYDEALEDRETDRSKDIRRYMRSVVNAPDPDESRQPPTDDETLAKGYAALRKAGAGRSVPVREAKSIVARETNIPSESVSRRVLKRLERRGYLAWGGDPINDPWVTVR
ncbi:hypothetical protein [Natronoarchaeum rubrum]|uniref:hypothetical protein n=1 Tax=Natronoarchaeum rubrum TaxID=755311 RepID=UPI002112D430|nr:hypothetical protein [Natronoarchaeum rubrum]